MSTETSQPFLPPEILLHIIDSVIVPAEVLAIAFQPGDDITRTLYSLTLTCRLTYPIALRLLYTKCLYIDSASRLYLLLRSFSELSERTANLPNGRMRTLPHVSLLNHITSLYLSPLSDQSENLSAALAVHDIFSIVAPTLCQLVIEIPLRVRDPSDDDLNIGPILRCAFTQLTLLEFFCSVEDELYLDCQKPPLNEDEPLVWSLWPKLRTLALYNPDLSDPRFWSGLGRLAHLDTLILTRGDALESVDMKKQWKKYCGSRGRGLSIALVNLEGEHRDPMGMNHWTKEDKVVVTKVNVPTRHCGPNYHIQLCQSWTKWKMLSGQEELSSTCRIRIQKEGRADNAHHW